MTIPKAGNPWKKLSFVVTNNDGYEGKEAIYGFDLFGEDKVDKFLKFNKLGAKVDVKFNIDCREGTGDYAGRVFTNLSAWSVFKAEEAEADQATEEAVDF